MNDRNRRWAFAVLLFIGALLPRDVMAVDGAVEINQAAAIAGGVTPGDAPGFPVVLTSASSAAHSLESRAISSLSTTA